MKNIIKIAFVLIMMISVTGCNNKKTNETVKEKMVFSEIQWPSGDLAKLLPVPESNIGNIGWEASYGMVVYMSKTSKEQYNEYIKKCIESGFTIDFRRGDNFYYASDSNQHKLSLRYGDEGDDVMFIRLDAPKKEEPDTKSSNENEPNESNPNTASETGDSNAFGVSQEFKDAMDSYEKFFTEYVDFIKKYSESSNSIEMLNDYTSYMTNYTDMMAKLEKLKSSNLSSEELTYYTEIMLRINEKLQTIL